MKIRSSSTPLEGEKPITKTTKSSASKKESKINDKSKKIQKQLKVAPAKKKVVEEKVEAEPKPKPEPEVPDVCPKYTPEKQALFHEKWKELIKLTYEEIKQFLRRFDQHVGGPKTELTDRAADIMVLGKIGKCFHCKHGTPKFDVGLATYYCPGTSDHPLKRCKRTLYFALVDRTPLTDAEKILN